MSRGSRETSKNKIKKIKTHWPCLKSKPRPKRSILLHLIDPLRKYWTNKNTTTWPVIPKTTSVTTSSDRNSVYLLPTNSNTVDTRAASAILSLKSLALAPDKLVTPPSPSVFYQKLSVTILSLTRHQSLRMISEMVCSVCSTVVSFQRMSIWHQPSKEATLPWWPRQLLSLSCLPNFPNNWLKNLHHQQRECSHKWKLLNK